MKNTTKLLVTVEHPKELTAAEIHQNLTDHILDEIEGAWPKGDYSWEIKIVEQDKK